MRSLTVFCSEGLSNRLRVLTSGLALAEATGRTFRMVWPRSEQCSASFDDLFANDWPVIVGSRAAFDEDGTAQEYYDDRIPDFHEADQEHLRVAAFTWLMPHSDQLCPRLIGVEIQPENRADPVDPRRLALIDRTKDFVRELRPAPRMQREIDEFRAEHFRSRMIGVHLRRGDFLNLRPDLAGNTPEAMAAVDRVLADEPDAGILLCSDDGKGSIYSTGAVAREGLHEKFRRRYGRRVVWTEPRRNPTPARRDGVHALLDLWLLRSTDYLIGTPWSSYSQMARVARDVPAVLVAGYIEKLRNFERFLRLTRTQSLVLHYGRRRYGYAVPLFMALRCIRSDLRTALFGK